MAVYRFRISFEDYEDTYRDIDVLASQTFGDLHLAIQKAIGFDASKPASFFMSNDLWKKGQEITFEKESGKSGADAILMSKARLSDFIADPHQKIYYSFDLPSHWTFFIELVRITANDPSKSYPAVTRSVGEAPKQYAIIEPPKGVIDPEFGEEELLLDEEEAEEQELVAETGTDDDEVEGGGFEEGVDEEEYDNIEEGTEESQDREEF